MWRSASGPMTRSQVSELAVIPWISRIAGPSPAHPVGDLVAVQADLLERIVESLGRGHPGRIFPQSGGFEPRRFRPGLDLGSPAG